MRSSSTGRRAVRASFLSIAVVTGLLIAIPSQAAVATAFIRVNQVGYPDSAPKRAYLMASDVETGGSFAVNAGGTTVFSASIGADQGSWSQAYPHVYALDFASVAAPGTYTIEVTGPIPATSPSFRIDGAAAVVRDRARQRALVLRERARRRRLRPVRASHGAFAPERRERDDLPHPARQLVRALQGRPLAAGGPDRRLGRLVGRGRLRQVRPDHELHGRHPDGRRPGLPGADGLGGPAT